MLMGDPNNKNLDQMAMTEIDALEGKLKDLVTKKEPFCFTLEDCLEKEFPKGDKCRPKACPFVDEIACRYVTSCLDKEVQQEYIGQC